MLWVSSTKNFRNMFFKWSKIAQDARIFICLCGLLSVEISVADTHTKPIAAQVSKFEPEF